ncbi:unnamed protein product [Cochlearia groenlandica]
MLPDDLVLNCLARVSILYYPILSLVSKRFRSLLTSLELYQTRTCIGHTESCLYVCLRFPMISSPSILRWFTICPIPNSSKKKTLVPVSFPDFPYTSWSKAVMVGPNIYVLGGSIGDNYTSSSSSRSVAVMDCRTHTWREAPSMQVARVRQSVCVLEGKIYITGGHGYMTRGRRENIDSRNWIEVFDTETQTWEFFQVPSEEIFSGYYYTSIGYERTLYIKSEEKNATYKLHKGRWRASDLMFNKGWGHLSSHIVIDNVFYRYSRDDIEWYDSRNRIWTTLKGLEGLYSLSRSGYNLNLVDCGATISVLWEEMVYDKREHPIWCAEIAIEKRHNGEIWGKLEWVDIVFTSTYTLVNVLATTL